MLNVILHSVELCNSNTRANRLIHSILPISTKWDHTDIREELHTGGGEENRDTDKVFNGCFRALYSAVEDDIFLTLKITNVKFQEMILHVEWPGLSN